MKNMIKDERLRKLIDDFRASGLSAEEFAVDKINPEALSFIDSGLSVENFARKIKREPDDIALDLALQGHYKSALNMGWRRNNERFPPTLEGMEVYFAKRREEYATEGKNELLAKHMIAQDEQLLEMVRLDRAISIYLWEKVDEYKKERAEHRRGRVKAGLHIEGQKFGLVPLRRQKSFFELTYDGLGEEARARVDEQPIEVVGLEFTQAQQKAYHAVQKLYTETDYKGNIEAQAITLEKCPAILKGFLFEGTLPRLAITPGEYFEAYGLEKRETGRGSLEYVGVEREDAWKALLSLANMKFIFSYKRLTDSKKRLFSMIRTVSPLIFIAEVHGNLDEPESEELKNNPQSDSRKLKAICIMASPILVDQHETWFVLKEANYLKEIEIEHGKVSPKVYLFIDWLIYQAHLNQRGRRGKGWDWVLPANPETLQYTLKMDSMIKNRNPARIKKVIAQAKKIALARGYLESFDENTVKLNPERFYRLFEKPEVKEMVERVKTEEAEEAQITP